MGTQTLSNLDVKALCMELLGCDTKSAAVELLRAAGVWDDDSMWRYYGDNESNWSQSGNQQAKPDAALMEKIVNSADALLMGAALEHGIDPQGPTAPSSVRDAVAKFFDADSKSATRSGDIRTWPKSKRTELAQEIAVFTTGEQGGTLSINVSDRGEGQTPRCVPETILSLAKGNKIRVPFVQGKFNQGGTGALRFCDLQVIVSRRNQRIADGTDPTSHLWSVTVVRREPPLKDGLRNSCFTYLAPMGHEDSPRKGALLTFSAEVMPLFPVDNDPYVRDTPHGTLVKLIGYNAKGFGGQAMRTGGLLPQINLMLPSLALPIRVHECRRGYGGRKEASFDTTAAGLTVRLHEDSAGNMEPGFPASVNVIVDGEPIKLSIYAFKPNVAKRYRGAKDALLYTIEGQTHARIGTHFFRSRAVNMTQIANSLLVIADCNGLSPAAIESLFMTSRDRLADGDLRVKVEAEIQQVLKDHDGLKKLRESRRRQEIEDQLGNSRPLEKVLDDVLRHSPTLAKLFLSGERLSSPFRTKNVATEEVQFVGKLHPTYFRFSGKKDGEAMSRSTHVNDRTRVKFETDVANDYFDRPLDPGEYCVYVEGDGGWNPLGMGSHTLNTFNGLATLSLNLPDDVTPGTLLNLRIDVIDAAMGQTFSNSLAITVQPAIDRQPSSGGKRKDPPTSKPGSERELPSGLSLPEWAWVERERWQDHEPAFTDQTAMEVVRETGIEDGESRDSYTFFVNADNVHLLRELKTATNAQSEVVRTRFATGCGLIALGMLHEAGKLSKEIDEDSVPLSDDNVEELVRQVTASVAPIIVPMIEALGEIGELSSSSDSSEYADD